MVGKKSGLIGTYKYAAKKSRSLVFKSYVFISSVVGIFLVFLTTLAGITWTANPVGTGPFREQILLGAILLVIVIPLVAPVFVVSRRQQKDRSTVRNEGFMAGAGYGYIVSLFITIVIGKAISRAVTWSGLGSVDKTFGLIFGIFRGYVICVCFFSLLNWFYPHQKWPLKAEGTYSFEIIYKGSEFLIDEFPNSKDYYEETEEKIEKI